MTADQLYTLVVWFSALLGLSSIAGLIIGCVVTSFTKPTH